MNTEKYVQPIPIIDFQIIESIKNAVNISIHIVLIFELTNKCIIAGIIGVASYQFLGNNKLGKEE